MKKITLTALFCLVGFLTACGSTHVPEETKEMVNTVVDDL